MLIIMNKPGSTPDRSADLLLFAAASTLGAEHDSPLSKGYR
jgi:hypothetical protein